MQKIVVIGAKGQLGQDIIAELQGLHGYEIIGLSRDNFSLDNMAILENLSNIKYIINAIAWTNVDKAESNIEECFAANAFFAFNLAKFMQKHPQAILMHFSTDYVYGDNGGIQSHENDMCKPQGIYAQSKLSGELLIQSYCERYFIFRTASLFGKHGAQAKGGNFISTMHKLATTKDILHVVSDQYSHPTHSLDLAKMVKVFILQNIQDFGVYNAAGSSYISWFDFAVMIFDACALDKNKLLAIGYNEYPFKAKRPRHSHLNLNKIEKYYKFPDCHTALKQYLELF